MKVLGALLLCALAALSSGLPLDEEPKPSLKPAEKPQVEPKPLVDPIPEKPQVLPIEIKPKPAVDPNQEKPQVLPIEIKPKPIVDPVPEKPQVLPIEIKPKPIVDPKPAEPCNTTCRKMCPFGFLLDGNCPRCTCAPNPCDNADCPKDNVCVPVTTDCGVTDCPKMASCKGLGLIMSTLPTDNNFEVEEKKEKPQVLPIEINPKPIVDPKPEKPQVLPIEINPTPIVDPKPAEPCSTTCRKMCPFGFLLDGNCPRCTCAPNPCDNADCPKDNVCVPVTTDCGVTDCPKMASCKGLGLIMPTLPTDNNFEVEEKKDDCKLTCRKHCEFGFVDDGSCPRCTCAPSPCETMNCGKDTKCEINRPADCDKDCPVLASCVPVEPVVDIMTPGKNGACEATAKKVCEFGFKTKGCPRSKCAKDPCARKKCKNGRVCTTKAKNCGFQTGCPHKAVCVKE